jgi:flagellar biosynthesis chaperone FliJ
MSAYPLQDMVRVREHREDQATQAVTKAQRQLKEARAALERKEQELVDYTAWRRAEEDRLLDSLMRRMLKLGEISDVRATIGTFRDRELELKDEVVQHEKAVAQAEAHLEECRQRQVKAVRDLEKLVEHRTIWQRARALEQEMAEDLELEDFSGPRGDRFNLEPSLANGRN